MTIREQKTQFLVSNRGLCWRAYGILELTSVLHHLPSAGPEQLCALARIAKRVLPSTLLKSTPEYTYLFPLRFKT